MRDTGIGIRDEDKAKLFQSFERFDSVRNRGIEGTGLGLAITKSFVELMNGNIQVESEKGKGSTFIVTVTLQDGTEHDPGKELEIRRALSETHLYSSAFDVEKKDGQFILHGRGWGHGVGLCQIGAAVMGEQGFNYDQILLYYYRGADIKRIYR